MVERQGVTAAEVAALREQLRAAQQGLSAPYRLALAWVARRAEAQCDARGGRAEAIVCGALRLVHGLLNTYDPARDPVAWVDALIAHAQTCTTARSAGTTDARGAAAMAQHALQERRTP